MQITFTDVKSLTSAQENEIASRCSNRKASLFRTFYLYSKYYDPIDYKMALLYDDKLLVGWAGVGLDPKIHKLAVQTYVKKNFRRNGYSTSLISEVLKYSKITRRNKLGCYSPVVVRSLTKLRYKSYIIPQD